MLAEGTRGTGTKNHRGTLRGRYVHYLPLGDKFHRCVHFSKVPNFYILNTEFSVCQSYLNRVIFKKHMASFEPRIWQFNGPSPQPTPKDVLLWASICSKLVADEMIQRDLTNTDE